MFDTIDEACQYGRDRESPILASGRAAEHTRPVQQNRHRPQRFALPREEWMRWKCSIRASGSDPNEVPQGRLAGLDHVSRAFVHRPDRRSVSPPRNRPTSAHILCHASTTGHAQLGHAVWLNDRVLSASLLFITELALLGCVDMGGVCVLATACTQRLPINHPSTNWGGRTAQELIELAQCAHRSRLSDRPSGTPPPPAQPTAVATSRPQEGIPCRLKIPASAISPSSPQRSRRIRATPPSVPPPAPPQRSSAAQPTPYATCSASAAITNPIKGLLHQHPWDGRHRGTFFIADNVG